MAKLRTDSPISRRIVLSFLDFLNSVDPGPGIDIEGLEVVRDCLSDIFELDAFAVDGPPQPNLLVDYFNALERRKREQECAPNISTTTAMAGTSSPSKTSETNHVRGSQTEGSLADAETIDRDAGGSKDELFDQFLGALRRINYLGSTPYGDDHHHIVKAEHLFDDALKVMENNGCPRFDGKSLAEALKTLGNHAMQSKLYTDAIDLYTFSIAIWENNAMYYCNRAAAYTQIQKYSEAIDDCHKSISIDPTYVKAYNRLGLALYEQGNYSDAISQGFMKALELDPSSRSIRDNIRLAEQKLKEELERNIGSQSNMPDGDENLDGDSTGAWGLPPDFTSIPIDASLPFDIANVFMNMAQGGLNFQQAVNLTTVDTNTEDGAPNPEIRVGGNISLNFEGPEQVAGSIRSLMEMFSAANPTWGGNTQQTSNQN